MGFVGNAGWAIPAARVWVRLALSVSLLAATLQPSVAISIMDSVWQANGGTDDNYDAGFAPFEALANEPQFDAASVRMTRPESDGSVHCSGTWIGNDDEHGYILSNSHCLDRTMVHESDTIGEMTDFDTSTTTWMVGDQDYNVAGVSSHPYYSGWSHANGADMAIFVLDRPVEGIDEPVQLYCGDQERGGLITIVGYGARQLASNIDNPNYRSLGIKTAGQNMIEEAKPNGNYLYMEVDVYGEAEDGDPFPEPVGDLEAGGSKGDSGGGIFMETDDGWVEVGVNSEGLEGYFAAARVSTQYKFINDIFPGATFVDGNGGDCSESLHARAGIVDIYTMNEFDENYDSITTYQDWMDGELTEADAEDQFMQAAEKSLADRDRQATTEDDADFGGSTCEDVYEVEEGDDFNPCDE